MSRWNLRSRSNRRGLSQAGALAQRAGGRGGDVFEALENRMLLADDHPNFGQVFNTQNPASVTEITLDGNGQGSGTGDIEVAQDNDILRFTFTGATPDFVTVWADTHNASGTLDSHVTIYTRSGPNNTPTLIASGDNSGTLTSGFNKDGWVGFIASPGQEYFIRVLSSDPAGLGAIGDYFARVDIKSDVLTVNANTGAATSGAKNLAVVGSDVIYKVTGLSTAIFDSLATGGIAATFQDFDPRLDIYSGVTGKLIIGDSEAGFLNNPFAAWRSGQDETFYIRVRGDTFNPADQVSTGQYTLNLDLAATDVPIDPVVRQGAVAGGAGGNVTVLYSFTAMGTGLTFVTMVPNGFPPIPDPAIHIYSDSGPEIGFNDDFAGVNAQIEIQLQGGKKYYLVAEGFDTAGGGGFAVVIEAHHTFANGIDDHANDEDFGNATPLIWNDPRLLLDPAGNQIQDRSFLTDAYGTGRIHQAGDIDLFSFVPPVDMLGDYAGSNDDNGTSLYAGGAFTQAGNITPTIPNPVNHIAAWDALDWWPARRGLDGPVYSMVKYDPPGPDPLALYVTGDFRTAGNTADPLEDIVVNGIARFYFEPLIGDYIWSAVGAGLGGTGVGRALTVFDPPDPDGGGPEEDPAPVLVVGGEFTPGGGGPGTRLAQWDGTAFTGIQGGANNTVFALTQWDPPDPDGNGQQVDPPPVLVVGGSFTQTNGVNRSRIAIWTGSAWQTMGAGLNNTVRALTAWDPDGDDDIPERLIAGGDFTTFPHIALWTGIGNNFAGLGTGINGNVHALTTFDDDADDDTPLVLIAGGSFTTAGGGNARNIAQWNGAWSALNGGVDNTVRALTSFADEDVGVIEDPVLYVGGDFSNVFNGPNGTPASRAAKWELDPILGYQWVALGQGVNASVYAMTEFDDGNPNTWDRNDRPSTRLDIVCVPSLGSFLNTFITVYDSQFNVLYTNDTIAPPFPDPSGMIDPSLAPGALGAIEGIRVWGGETYYIAISGAGTGRYDFRVTADAFVKDDANSTITDPPGSGGFASAPELIITNATGDARNFLASPFAAHEIRSYVPTGSGFNVTTLSELGNISNPDDVDLFKFRAPADGTAEIRIDTTQLADNHVWTDGFDVISTDKTYDSRLDSLLRIFDNDFEQIALGDDFAGVDGATSVTNVGSFANKTFTRTDPSVVFEVKKGETYFIQIESAALAAFTAGNMSEIDWRNATGSYELLINTMPNLSFDDDHINDNSAQATVIPMDYRQFLPGGAKNQLNGHGDITGVVDNTLANPSDRDRVTFIAGGDGVAKITVTPGADGLIPFMQVFDGGGNLVSQSSQNSSKPLTANIIAKQGDRFTVLVAGAQNSEGSWTVSIDGVPYVDDFASLPKWMDSEFIEAEEYDYDGAATRNGKIETPGDTDVFKFTTIDFDVATLRIKSNSQSLGPTVRVYEVSVDLAGNPVLLLIAGSNGNGGLSTAQVQFSLTAPDRATGQPPKTYNEYYVLVSGANPDVDRGNYTLTLNTKTTDDHPDAGQFDVAHGITIDQNIGTGSDEGELEVSADTDLFKFVSPGQGTAKVTITSPVGSLLLPRVRIYDANENVVIDKGTLQPFVDGNDADPSKAVFTFNTIRDTVYYIEIDGVGGGSVKTDDFGAYTVDVLAPTLDDHANEGEFEFATPVGLSKFSGDGQDQGVFEIPADSDLFTFTSLTGGKVKITMTRNASFITPVMQLFRADETQIGSPVTDGGPGDEDGQANGSVTRSITAAAKGEVYYILTKPSEFGFSKIGAYNLLLDGPKPPESPTDDFPDSGEFGIAAPIPLAKQTGDGFIKGNIEFLDDTDLFQFTSQGTGIAFVQIITPKGQAMDLAVRVFGPDQQQIAFDGTGIQGVNAYATFDVLEAGQKYYVEVSALDSNIGSYTVNVDASPAVHYLYFPEGFANKNIREYVALSNPNDFAVTYTIRLRFSGSISETVIANNAVIQAGKRGGITISNGDKGSIIPKDKIGKSYSIVIESNGPLGGSISHYDFGSSLGEAFTPITSTTWDFAKVERFPGVVADFIPFYNPNATAVSVQLTAYVQGQAPVVLFQTVGAFHRGGWDISKTAAIPAGTFAVRLSSSPVNPDDEHIGIVAALSHFDLANGVGYALLGDPEGGATRGVIPGLTSGGPSVADVSIFNPAGVASTVTITGKYIDSGLPDIVRIVNVPAKGSVHLSGQALGIADNQSIGLIYSSTQAVTVSASERKFGDANATSASTEAGTSWFFGDAFINTTKAGTSYLEDLFFYNPGANPTTITIDLFFNNGDKATAQVVVGGNDFNSVALHDLPQILDRGGLATFSIQVHGDGPFAVMMTHYDLVLGGGWGSSGSPLGLTNPFGIL